MTPQERELLSAFLQQMTLAQAGQKDAEADALIREAALRQPDTSYLLVQRAMGMDYALQAAQAQIAKLQAELDQQRSNAPGSFLGASNAWGRQTPAPNPAQPPVAPAALARPAAQAAPAAAAQASSWGSGMLGSIATTAAGVVAGSLLFQGMQGLMGHHNQTATAPQPAREPEKLASKADEQDDAADDSEDYADSGSGDGDDGDSA